MKEVFAKRRLGFNQQCLKYLRYVFNDHFVLVLVFLLGFINTAICSSIFLKIIGPLLSDWFLSVWSCSG